MKKLTFIILLALGAVRFSSAQDPTVEASAAPTPPAAVAPAVDSTTPPPTEPEQAPAAPEPTPAPEPNLETKAKSSFAIDESGRNPFWPIGWKPVVKTVTNERAGGGSEVRETAFLVSSITLDQGAKFAIINGKVMGEGQVFGLQMGSQTYQITVKSIQDGQVILQRRDQEIVVPLRRK